ncbi:MAG: carotenoid biosynthesis protein [Bacteroidales bacterium]|jgi:putative membrane protein|nr:carotenoid biosynthesis protein [Bacteroidales bacterium]
MIENVRKYPVIMIAVISFYYLVGIIGLSLETTRELFRALVPFTLLFSLYFLWLFQENPSLRFYTVSLVIFLLGFFIEVVGVKTGWFFGHYVYGETLGFKILSTPLMIGVNWLFLIISCWSLTGLFLRNRWLRYKTGALFMVIYDIFLEPVAVRLDMWSWQGDKIPLQNYIGWYITSWLLFIILDQSRVAVKNKIAPSLFIIQFLFFVILNIINYLS